LDNLFGHAASRPTKPFDIFVQLFLNKSLGFNQFIHYASPILFICLKSSSPLCLFSAAMLVHDFAQLLLPIILLKELEATSFI
jgi:hypothetical protein